MLQGCAALQKQSWLFITVDGTSYSADNMLWSGLQWRWDCQDVTYEGVPQYETATVKTAVVACDENIMISLLIINRWLEMDNRETVFSADNMQSLVAVAGTGTPPAGPWLCCP